MPIDPIFWQRVSVLYHSAPAGSVDEILSSGLLPWDESPGTRFVDEQEWHFHEPRSGHVYLSTSCDPVEPGHVVLEVDPRQLDPQLVNADEDWVSEGSGRFLMGRMFGDGDGTLGEMAEAFGLGDDPQHSRASLEEFGTVAYRGCVPPSAVRRID